ncbi:MAG: PadR family transcriptional regulator, partial [Ktedonobacterales bacterium]
TSGVSHLIPMAALIKTSNTPRPSDRRQTYRVLQCASVYTTRDNAGKPGGGTQHMAHMAAEQSVQPSGARGERSAAGEAGEASATPETPESGGAQGRNTLRFIILGLLGARPMTGYDIKRAFDRSLATYWNAGNSQIYTTLKLLSARGLVMSELISQEGRPSRRVYRLTERGHAELAAWLDEPVPARFTKDEFLTRLFFCGLTSDEAALRHLEEHRAALQAQLGEMDRALREYGARPTRRPRLLEYQMLVRDYKQAILQTDLDVTERAIVRLHERL